MEEDINPYRVAIAPNFQRAVAGVDPPGGATEAGIVTVGRGHNGHYYVTHDDSGQAPPNIWMGRCINRAIESELDTLVVETNFGGDMVEAGIKNIDPRVGVKAVRASRGKAVRAEPVQQLYAAGKVHHVGTFMDLERELCTWRIGDKSPNRLDALVWAISDLMEYDDVIARLKALTG
jgi:phage terminase large subunit-like protein